MNVEIGKTIVWNVDKSVDENHPLIKEVAEQLKEGKTIAFPTETVYGLGANAYDTEAVKKIFQAKGRPSDNPLIVHIAEIKQVEELVEHIDDQSKLLMEKFWPGPLTIIFKRKAAISPLVTAGLRSLAIRMPDHPVALALLKACQLPIAAPSANRSGRPSPTTAEHVYEDLNGRIAGIVDAGPTGIGVESTVIDVSGEVPTVLRPGGITIEELEGVLGEVILDPALVKQDEKPRSPGMKYTHYAPKGEMWIVKGTEQEVMEQMMRIAHDKEKEGLKVGILTLDDHRNHFKHLSNSFILSYGTKGNLYPLAEHLYDALRSFDQQQVDYIVAEAVEEKGIGLTIMNRLNKAAGGNMIQL